jgi:hypothetical protein
MESMKNIYEKSEILQTYRGVRQGSVLSPALFNMIMDEVIKRVTEGQESGTQKIMIYADDIVVWEPNEST